MNLLGMIFSMCGLMLKLKWCAWVAVYCSFISFANSQPSANDTPLVMSLESYPMNPMNTFPQAWTLAAQLPAFS
ncbi:Protein Asterix [Galemys pyrenaicus]|uniref:PAT complex subunit Asterix n=1 Tax=Galemys pyrenaicus TaxID=202257 RepID=A0A8J6AAN1_GALPY|nr:Protein Asterix [Galemys pyrenaicus]